MPKDYGSWSLLALKAELRKRNAKVTGKKAVLVQRLLDYDVMFGGLVNDPETCYRIMIPRPESFHDINSATDLPSVNEADILKYCILGERENIETSKNMYDENFLLTSRSAQEGNDYYLTAVCAAEMRKNVTYTITIKMEENTIAEAQCECAAGMGPYAQCKHVLILMWGLIDFSQTKNIKTRSSVTSVLQTFHHPSQKYSGEPVKAETLKLKQNDKIIKTVTTFDPRSNVQVKEKYSEDFKNKCVNFSATTTSSMPILQLIKPANKIALFSDHDYLKKTAEENFLEDQELNDEQRMALEAATREDKKKWKKERQRRIQSSNFGKICKNGSNKQNMAKSFFKNIEIITPAIKHGLKYEKKAIEMIKDATGEDVKKCGIFVCKKYNFLASTPDGLLGEDGVVEVKCPYTAKNQQITPETVPYLYLCNETGNFKLKEDHDYFYQVQGQMLCTGRKICYFGIYTITDFHLIKVERNDDFIKEMLAKLINFYECYYRYLFLCRYLYNIKI